MVSEPKVTVEVRHYLVIVMVLALLRMRRHRDRYCILRQATRTCATDEPREALDIKNAESPPLSK